MSAHRTGPDAPRETKVNGTTAAARAADILLAFMDSDAPLGVSRISRELGLSKAVVHRVLTTFVDRGLLVLTNPGREYELGPAAAALGVRALRSFSLREVARPFLDELSAATGETATVTALVGTGRMYIDQVESPHEIKLTVETGRRFPLYTGSSGRCLLAFQPEAIRNSVLTRELAALTDKTITDPDTLRSTLERIRHDGWCSSVGERQEGAASVAAPVFDLDGRAVGSLSVCGPISRMTDEKLPFYTSAVTTAAKEVSKALGWRGGLPDHAKDDSDDAPS